MCIGVCPIAHGSVGNGDGRDGSVVQQCVGGEGGCTGWHGLCVWRYGLHERHGIRSGDVGCQLVRRQTFAGHLKQLALKGASCAHSAALQGMVGHVVNPDSFQCGEAFHGPGLCSQALKHYSVLKC